MNVLKMTSCCLAALVLLATTSVMAVDFRKDDFSFTLPAGWEEIPGNEKSLSAKKAEDDASKVPEACFDHAFRLAQNGPDNKYPRLYVKIDRKGRIPANQLDNLQKFSTPDDIEKCNTELLNMAFGSKIYDKARRIIWMRLEAKDAAAGPVFGLSGIVLTETGFIQVTGYSAGKENAADMAAFQAAVLSVAPTPQIAYKPKLTDRLPASVTSLNWGYVFGDGLIHILLAVGAGGVGTVVISRTIKS